MLSNMNLFGDNNNKKLYHGSSKVVEHPIFRFGKSDNDYGSGFYTTEDYDKAVSWALLNGNEEAFVNYYELNFKNLNIIY